VLRVAVSNRKRRNSNMNDEKLWRHIHFNTPKVLLENFEDAIVRSLDYGNCDSTRTGALRKAMELYINWVSRGCPKEA
jgi:hypothetical protein